VLVRVMQTGAHGEKDGARDIGREPTRVESAPHSPAGEPFNNQQAQPLVIDEVVERHDVRMIQCRKHSRFGDKAPAHGRIRAERKGQTLDCHEPPELTVTAGEDHTICAATEFAADLVCGKRSNDTVVIGHGRSLEAWLLRQKRKIAQA
jgi:hypothetical protein